MTQRNLRGAYMNFAHDRQADWDFLREWQPSVMHLMLHGSHTDPNSVDVNRIKRVHDTCPDALILLRVWDVDDRNFEAHNAMVANPIAEADKQLDWWNAVIGRVQGVPRNQLMAGLNNETGPEKDAALYAYTERALTRGTQLGIRLGALVFSVGRPSLPGESQYDMAYFSRLEALFLAGNHSMLLNEYMQPEGMYAVWTDAEGRERKDYSYLIGRHKRWPMNVPVILGEWGIEGILYNRHRDPNYGNSGWLNFPALWPASRYADEYVECVKQAGDNVIGICPFLSDYADRRWASADVLPAYGELMKRKELCVKEVVTTHLPSIGSPIAPPQPTVPPLAHPVPGQQPRLIWPVKGVITQRWGESPQNYARFGIPGHNGLDIANSAGTPILSVADGVVAFVGTDTDYGIYVRINHPQLGFDSFYAHLQAAMVTAGERVRQGKQIGAMGTTGNSTGNHVHVEFRLSNGNSYVELSGGFGKGRVDPLIVYHLLNHVSAIVQPAPNDLRSVVTNAAIEFGINPDLFDRLVQAESSYRPDVVSSAGAVGLAQIAPATFAEHAPSIGATNIYDPQDNARVGAAYLRWLIDYLDGDVYKSLLAFNWGIGNILSGRTPPVETVEYANKILGN